MIGYVTLGTNDLERSGKFYDPITQLLGWERVASTDRMIMWGNPGKEPMLSVIKPFDEQDATAGNGTMVGLKAKSEDQVNEIHKLALSSGSVDEGTPGYRTEAFYAGYFRDPDGNKLVAYLFKEQ
jgi:predicted lactoylglutathione lyase